MASAPILTHLREQCAQVANENLRGSSERVSAIIHGASATHADEEEMIIEDIMLDITPLQN